MAIFEVDFIFCCSCLCPIFLIQDLWGTKNFELTCFAHRRNTKKVFGIDNFKKDSSMPIACIEHLCESMYFGTCVCLYYNSDFLSNDC